MTMLSGEAVNAELLMKVLSYEATLITFLPTAGAAEAYRPTVPSLPAEHTTTMPLFTSFVAAAAVGYDGHWNAAPMLMLITCIPSASAISMASIMTSELVLFPQPNT